MTDILPQPVDLGTPVVSNIEPATVVTPHNKRTMWLLVAVVIIAILCLTAGYIYDVVSNHNRNNTRRQDLSYISAVMTQYYELYGHYPTLNQVNSSTFGVFDPGLSANKFKDPNSTSTVLSAQPSSSSYAYQPTPVGCNNVSFPCSGYKLTATLSDGNLYIVTNPSHIK